MRFDSNLKSLIGRAASFIKADRGNVAMMFAIAALPVIGAVGAAIDYTREVNARTAMQAAIDATALMLAQDAPSLSAAQLTSKAQAYFNGLYNHPEVGSVTLNASYTANAATGGSTVVLTGSGSLSSDFMQLVGYPTMSISVNSTATWGNVKLRVALVLDNTGSMNNFGKITALQTATKNLLTQLQQSATNNGDVYVSIVPFVKDVNVGASNYTATWIDWTAWNAANQTCSGGSWTWSFSNGWQYTGGTCTPNNHNTWNGCVVDRGDSAGPNVNFDTNATAPTVGVTATMYSAEQYGSCPQAAMGLNYNWSSMTTLVNNMVAAGNTNQAIGLQLGWLSLTGGGPFTAPAMDPNYTYSQVIILLTDGLNTQDRWYTDQTSIDNRQQITCDNVKAAGITLYTIQVNTDGDPTSTLLQNCASSSSKFFLLTSANQIVTTFNNIGTQLSKLRISR